MSQLAAYFSRNQHFCMGWDLHSGLSNNANTLDPKSYSMVFLPSLMVMELSWSLTLQPCFVRPKYNHQKYQLPTFDVVFKSFQFPPVTLPFHSMERLPSNRSETAIDRFYILHFSLQHIRSNNGNVTSRVDNYVAWFPIDWPSYHQTLLFTQWPSRKNIRGFKITSRCLPLKAG